MHELEVLKCNGDEKYHDGNILAIKADSAGPGEIFENGLVLMAAQASITHLVLQQH